MKLEYCELKLPGMKSYLTNNALELRVFKIGTLWCVKKFALTYYRDVGNIKQCDSKPTK